MSEFLTGMFVGGGAMLVATAVMAAAAATAVSMRRQPLRFYEPEEWGDEIYRPPRTANVQAPAPHTNPHIITPETATAPRVITRLTRLTRQERTTEL
jgi:hypothetical protein